MCGKNGRFLWLLLLFFWVLLPATGQEDKLELLPMSENSQQQEPKPILLPNELLMKWNEYDLQFKDSVTTLEQFLDQVEAFGIKFEDLPNFMTLLVSSYEESEKSRLQEREIFQEALKKEKGKKIPWILSSVGLAVLSGLAFVF